MRLAEHNNLFGFFLLKAFYRKLHGKQVSRNSKLQFYHLKIKIDK